MKMKYLLCYCLLLVTFLCCKPDSRNNLIPFENKKGKWGYKDAISEKKIISAKYALAYPFFNHYAPVGIEDLEGNIKIGMIDTLCHYVLKPEYESIEYENNGYIQTAKSSMCGLLDSTLQIVIPSIYSSICLSDYRHAFIKQDSLWGCFNIEQKKEIIPCEYDQISLSGYRHFYAVQKNKKYGFYNLNGERITPVKYDGYNKFHESERFLAVEINRKNGIIDTTGREVIPCKYKSIQPTSDSTFYAYSTNNTIVLLNSEDHILFSGKDCCEGHFLTFFENGLMPFYGNNGKWGVINTRGKTVIPFMYDLPPNVVGKFADVQKGGKRGVINLQNETIFPFSSDLEYSLLRDSTICIYNIKKRKSKLISYNREEIIPYKYTNIEYLNGCSYYLVLNKEDETNNRLYGIVNKKGEEILAVKYKKYRF